jgi:hypothetical protein
MGQPQRRELHASRRVSGELASRELGGLAEKRAKNRA